MFEINEAAKVITESIDREAKVIFGAVQDDQLKKGEIKITVIATGFPNRTTRQTTFAKNSAVIAKKYTLPWQEGRSLKGAGSFKGLPYSGDGASLPLESAVPQAHSYSVDDLKKRPAYLRNPAKKLK
jgi:hypothetical protein